MNFDSRTSMILDHSKIVFLNAFYCGCINFRYFFVVIVVRVKILHLIEKPNGIITILYRSVTLPSLTRALFIFLATDC